MPSKLKNPIAINRFCALIKGRAKTGRYFCLDPKLLWLASLSLLWSPSVFAAPRFISAALAANARYEINGPALCATAKQTLAYLNHGTGYDPQVIHPGHVLPIDLARVKATLIFICQNQTKLNDPVFLQQHFEFIRWLPDIEHAKQFSANKPLLKNQPRDRILMTKSEWGWYCIQTLFI